MSYVATGSFSREQEEALFDISPEKLRALPLEKRVELALQHLDAKARKREAFWTAVEGFATGALPILAVLGIIRAGKK